MTEFQEETSEPTRALKSPNMTRRSEDGIEERVDWSCHRRLQRGRQLQKWSWESWWEHTQLQQSCRTCGISDGVLVYIQTQVETHILLLPTQP